MAQIDDFFMYENRVEGITDADYQRVQPYVEAAHSDNPLFLCGHTADEVRQMGYGFYPISTNHQCSKHPCYALWN